MLVMFSGLEPQLEGDDPLILLEKRGVSYAALLFSQWSVCVLLRGGGKKKGDDLERDWASLFCKEDSNYFRLQALLTLWTSMCFVGGRGWEVVLCMTGHNYTHPTMQAV